MGIIPDCPKEHWDRYDHESINLPRVGALPDQDLDPHSRRLRAAYQADVTKITPEDIKNARRAYYGQISYIDDKIGNLLKALDDTGMKEDTIILFTADHGDMLGEKGLWYKMSFFEGSARVPLLIHAPQRYTSKRVDTPVSLVDLLPTLLDVTNAPHFMEPADTMDGESLVPLLENGDGEESRTVISEFLGEGAIAPCFMVRQGDYKYIYSQPDPPQLYDLRSDPEELTNLAGNPDYTQTGKKLHQAVLDHQDPEKVHQAVLASQDRRRLVFTAHMTGKHTPWDFQPIHDASNKYMRNHLDLYENLKNPYHLRLVVVSVYPHRSTTPG